MKRFVSLLILSLAVPVLASATDCRDHTDSSARRQDPVHFVARQLVRTPVFEPDCIDYFPQAVRELGFFGALFSTADRMTRSTRIGAVMAAPGSDGKVHEGPEAYKTRRRKK